MNPKDSETLSSLGLSELLEEALGDDGDGEKGLNLPGSGVAIPLLKGLNESSAVLLNTFTTDGDNRGDAVFMAHAVNEWLKLLPSDTDKGKGVNWKTPSSWKMLFGADVDPILY